MLDLFNDYLHLLPIIGLISVLVFVISLVSLPWLVALIPEDYFSSTEPRPPSGKGRNPLIRIAVLSAKIFLAMYYFLEDLLCFCPWTGCINHGGWTGIDRLSWQVRS